MSDRLAFIEIRDLANPTEYYATGYSYIVYDVDTIVSIVSEPRLYKNTSPLCSLINKESGNPLYWRYELLNHIWKPVAYLPNEFESYFYIPFTEEQIPDLDAKSITYGRYYAYPWNHLEVSDSIFIQGLFFKRSTDGGDNLKRMYINETSRLDDIMGIVRTTTSNMLGVTCIPCTDRLYI